MKWVQESKGLQGFCGEWSCRGVSHNKDVVCSSSGEQLRVLWGPPQPRCILWLRRCRWLWSYTMPCHTPHRPSTYLQYLTLFNGWREIEIEWTWEGHMWFNQMRFCSLGSCLTSVFDCVALSHLNVIMSVLFFSLYFLVFSGSLNRDSFLYT